MSPLIRLLASSVALMMAMGIGRFALTPQMPHLLSEGQIDLTGAGLLAAANYLGYFVGAVDSIFARSHQHVRGRLYGGLWLCVLLTLASYWANGFWPHLLLRFGTGVASAWALVMITSLSQPLAIAAGRPRLGALVFAGPGLGIVLTGLLALVSNLSGQSSAALWLIYGTVALVMLLAILPFLPKPTLTVTQPTSAGSNGSIAHLCCIYFLYGLGYIIPATFLSQMASAQFHGAWQADLFWPCFGLAAALGSGGGQPAPQAPEHHPSLADGDFMAASGRGVRLPIRQWLGLGVGRFTVRCAISGLHAVGDGAIKGGRAPWLPTQHGVVDRQLRRRPIERPPVGIGQQPSQWRPATGVGRCRYRVVISRFSTDQPPSTATADLHTNGQQCSKWRLGTCPTPCPSAPTQRTSLEAWPSCSGHRCRRPPGQARRPNAQRAANWRWAR